MKIEGKDTIRKTALDIIAYEGLENLTMSTLAHELEITKASLYHYYKSKDDIIDEIYTLGHKELMQKGFRLNLSGTIEEVLTEASEKWESLFLDENLAPFLRMIFSLYLIDDRAKDEHQALTLMLKSQSDVIINTLKKESQNKNEILSNLFSSLLLTNLERILSEDEVDLESDIVSFAKLLEEI